MNDWIYIILVVGGIAIGIAAFIVAFIIDEKRPYSFTSLTIDLLEELEREYKSYDTRRKTTTH